MKPPAPLTRLLRKPYVDHALCLLLKRRRLSLPPIDPATIWPDFETAPVTIDVLPKGDWSAPTNDVVVLMKLAAAMAPDRIVELGSYRGYTARALLLHAPPAARLTAVDIEPEHGEAYRGTPLEERVDRRVAPISLAAFDPDELGTYDLVFVDADHSAEAVANDTSVALELVAPSGTVLWHDYANWGWFTGDCGVPEVVNAAAAERPIAHVLGSNIAIHRPAWTTDRSAFERALQATSDQARLGHWRSGTARRYA